MIDSVADYEMVDVTGLERFVKGEILPVREGGAKRALKYEDLLFLKEGKLERQNWTQAANAAAKANKAAAPSRWLRKATFESAVCSGTWRDYRDADKEITEGIVPVADRAALIGDNPPTVEGAIAELVGDEVALGNFDAGRTLKLERLEMAYENMGKLKRTLEGVFANVLWTRRGRWHDKNWPDGEDPYERYGTWNMNYNLLYWFRGTDNSSSVMEFEEGLKTRAYPYAVKAWLILPIRTDVDGGISTERGKAWIDLKVIECGVTQREAESGLAKVSWQDLAGATIAQEILGSHGETYYGEPTRVEGTKDQSLMLGEAYILIEHDFPASEPEEG